MKQPTEMNHLNSFPEDDNSSSNSNDYGYQDKKVPLGSYSTDLEAEIQNFLPDGNLGKKKYETEYHQGNASFGMSVFNLGNAIMGSGILGLSYAMANTGILLFILLVAVAIFSLYSVHLLLKTANEGALVYEQLGYKAFGMPGKLAASCCITMQNIGMSSYLFIVKYELPIVIQSFLGTSNEWYTNGDYLVLLVTAVIILPLSLLKNLYLGYTSGLSLLCMVFFLIVVIIKKFQIPCPHMNMDEDFLNETLNITFPHLNNSEDACTPKYVVFNSQTVYAVPILTFAFVCHPAILPMYDELKKMQNVANVSFLAMFIMYLLAALFGYLTFNHVEPELLHTYSKVYKSDVVLLIVRLAVLTAVTLTVPVVLFPQIRTSVNQLMCASKDFSWVRHTLITLVLLGGTNALVIFVPTIRDIFGFIASAAAMLIFILPSAFYIKLVKKESMKSMQKIGLQATAFLICGFLVMIGSMTLIILDWTTNSTDNHEGH
uniref:Sodium-coupled neutral amino acid symporter 2 n=1 Tax=Periophthalmus magnuspinnatus TaxID=409849 RepID=A0A3B3ZXY5_9GOBI